MGSTMEHWDWDYVIDWEVQWSIGIEIMNYNGALGLRLCNWLGSTMEHWDWDYVIDWEVQWSIGIEIMGLRLCNWEVQWSIGIEIM